jgi:hypothetical protein
LKSTFNYIFLLIFAMSVVFITSCEKPASEMEYGFPLIYMPQASLITGGLDNNYPVPSADTVSPNYRVDEVSGKIYITLGVYRSGLQELAAFSVDVYSKTDTATTLTSDSIVAYSAVLPSDVYSFPSTVSVEDGKREKTFYLTLDGNKLNTDYPELLGRTLVVAIGLRNPSKYELNQSLAATIILIKSDAFMPMP